MFYILVTKLLLKTCEIATILAAIPQIHLNSFIQKAS